MENGLTELRTLANEKATTLSSFNLIEVTTRIQMNRGTIMYLHKSSNAYFVIIKNGYIRKLEHFVNGVSVRYEDAKPHLKQRNHRLASSVIRNKGFANDLTETQKGELLFNKLESSVQRYIRRFVNC